VAVPDASDIAVRQACARAFSAKIPLKSLKSCLEPPMLFIASFPFVIGFTLEGESKNE